jgi:hypothetical protein
MIGYPTRFFCTNKKEGETEADLGKEGIRM